MSIKIAIAGSGPSGFYAMEGLSRVMENCQIDILDRLPTPYGLVRAGVAPDHLGTKNVSNQYEKNFQKCDAKFFGNIELGRDIAIDELEKLYDAVVIATGAPRDRKLGIPGENLPGIYGSAAFTGWYNGHPDYADLMPDLGGKTAIIIGNGNVSLDIARLLLKTAEERAESDLHHQAEVNLNKSRFKAVHIVGRRGPRETSFTPPELRELGRLQKATPVIDAKILADIKIDEALPDGRILKKNIEIFNHFATLTPESGQARAHLEFYAAPRAFIGTDKVTKIRFEKNRLEAGKACPTGAFFTLDADLVVTAIGYRSRRIKGLSFDEKRGLYPNEEGHIRDQLYVVGWGKRGPSGTIPTNRADSFSVAKKISEKITGGHKKGRAGLVNLIDEKNLRATSFSDWKILDKAETKRATGHKPREKFTSIADMLAEIGQGPGR